MYENLALEFKRKNFFLRVNLAPFSFSLSSDPIIVC